MNNPIQQITGRPPQRSPVAQTVDGYVSSPPLAIQYDDAGSGITYIGKASAGTATSAASWQIMKLDESSSPDFSITWADGNGSFDNVWNDRASLSYS